MTLNVSNIHINMIFFKFDHCWKNSKELLLCRRRPILSLQFDYYLSFVVPDARAHSFDFQLLFLLTPSSRFHYFCLSSFERARRSCIIICVVLYEAYPVLYFEVLYIVLRSTVCWILLCWRFEESLLRYKAIV